MKTTVAEYLVTRGLPATWCYASPFGRIAAETYRSTYRREPRHAFRLINGRFRRVMAYRASERHVLDTAWEIYPRCTDPSAAVPSPRRTVARIDRVLNDYSVSGDAMRWQPGNQPLTRHP
ncbi:hypothetical protein DEJ49_33080 [Streptomyces venezuelae]|uniref:Uncharacterized protein n=1 Tax=Streptomyces venezuelae TaxID=54571 RepID=A0A5P2CT52_STRVZ|nr:hypothetical protein [Streptomyces venezuelae]QES45177.1 hypothetical protein DEJ49_33080 [Streptomyces venezuelae]